MKKTLALAMILTGLIASGYTLKMVFYRSDRVPSEYQTWAEQTVRAAMVYLTNKQAADGDLPYQLTLDDGQIDYRSSTCSVRNVAAVGALYNSYRLLRDQNLLEAANKGLKLCLDDYLIARGELLYLASDDRAALGGQALLVDAIYKMYLVSDPASFRSMNDNQIVQRLGQAMIEMKRTDGVRYFYHSLKPSTGEVDPEEFVVYFDGETLMSFWELYEMTGNEYWKNEALGLNQYMQTLPVNEDHWYAYSVRLMSRHVPVDNLSLARVGLILQMIEGNHAGHLRPAASTISTSTKLEAMTAIRVALKNWGQEEPVWLEPRIQEYIAWIAAHQLPKNICGWKEDQVPTILYGGILTSCEKEMTYVRIDGQQHFVNGLITYLLG